MWMSEARASTARPISLIDEADDRRLAGDVLQPFGVVVAAVDDRVAQAVDDLAESHVAAAAVQAFEGAIDVGGHGDTRRSTGRPMASGDARGGEVVERIGHRDDDVVRLRPSARHGCPSGT